MNVVERWRRVHQRNNPSMPASVLMALMRVMAPGRVKHHRDLPPKMDEWHALLVVRPKDYWEYSSCNMKVAALLRMSPFDV